MKYATKGLKALIEARLHRPGKCRYFLTRQRSRKYPRLKALQKAGPRTVDAIARSRA